MILYNNIVEISKNRWIGYMLKVAFLLASSILSLLSMKLISRCVYAYIYIHYMHSLSKKFCKQ